MGSAADALLHLVAYAMTAPDLDRETLVRVMAFMQGPGLVVLAPMILSFFAGGAIIAHALGQAGRGLTVLACVAGAQLWSGVAVSQRVSPRAEALAAIR